LQAGRSPAWPGLFIFAFCLGIAVAPAFAHGDAGRGAYLAKAGGCVGCHTEKRKGAVPFAGGRALKTPFGTFYGPNITPHRDAGIGRWSEEDFQRALRLGVGPDGRHFFPAFPFPSFTRITDDDARDLWAYLTSLAPSARPNRPHELWFPSGWRLLAKVWQELFFDAGAFVPRPALTAQQNRGAYLVDALGHCGECHTPRNLFGARDRDRYLAGAKLAEGGGAPNLTPTRLKKWDDAELKDFLSSGLTPDGDVVGETMGEVIRNTTGQLTPQDLAAVVAYLRTVPPLPDAAR
jgi:mono/diheme cytochrome c family protein